MSRASRHSATPDACPRTTRQRSWEERCRKSSSGSATVLIRPRRKSNAFSHRNRRELMWDALVWSFHTITNINWLEIIKTLAPVTTTVIALIALKNWQHQDKAKREAEFIDVLIEATHTYIAEM